MKALVPALLIVALSACGGSDGGDPPPVSNTPVPTPVASGTPTPAPSPTASATPTPSPTPAPITYGPELITNGGFEDDPAGTDAPSGGWMITTNADGAAATAEVVESTAGADAHTGTKALRVDVTTLGTNAWSTEVVYGPFDIVSSQNYEYSFWVKGASGTQVNFTAGDETFAELTRNEYTLSGSDWQQVKFSIGIPEGFGQLRLPTHLSISGNAGQRFYLDDLSLRAFSTEIVFSPVDVPSLKALAPNNLPIGVAVPAGSAENSVLTSMGREGIVTTHFSQLTAENIMKMSFMQPSEDNFTFDDADALVSFAQNNSMSVHGHALVWHNQAPQWMHEFEGDRDAWIAMMETHVSTVAGHFHAAGDTVVSWDVVNEAFNDSGSLRGSSPGDTGSQDSIWYDNIGEEYIELAFREAREADPDADLYYNDYGLLAGGTKLNLAIDLINDFQTRGVPIDGLGFQGHIGINFPSIADMRQSLQAAVDIEPAIKIKITELDVRVNDGNQSVIFTSEMAEAQKAYIRDLVEAYLDIVPVEQRGGISVWGIHDGDTWLIDFLGRIEWPLLFSENLEPKPALQGFADALEGN